MTCQGQGARPVAVKDTIERRRCFAGSRVSICAGGHVSPALRAKVNSAANQAVYKATVSPAAGVVDAIHGGALVAAVGSAFDPDLPERLFVSVQSDDGRECTVLAAAPTLARELADMAVFDR